MRFAATAWRDWRRRLRRPKDVIQTGEILNKLDKIEAQLSRMWLNIDFIRTHSATYLGDGIALTHLVDETPIIVNSNDFGGPMRLISGGRYEEDNLEVLLSFLTDDSTFVDVGANVGFFSLRLGDRLRRHGRVLAFEPHPKLAGLIRRNVHINGLTGVVAVHDFGLSDVEAAVGVNYPKGHLGGGSVGFTSDSMNFDVIPSQVRRLDDVLDPGLAVDLVKIDIEGHELAALRGMRDVIDRSPRIVILFEKLGIETGNEGEIEALFAGLGLLLYSVNINASLAALAPGDLAALSGYAIAARPGRVDRLNRQCFSIYPSQLAGAGQLQPGEPLIRSAEAAEMLFHGPYWFLPRGQWELLVIGEIVGDIEISIAERFGHIVDKLQVSSAVPVARFVTHRDLIHFELIARPVGQAARVKIGYLELVRFDSSSPTKSPSDPVKSRHADGCFEPELNQPALPRKTC